MTPVESLSVTESLSYLRLPDSPRTDLLQRLGHDGVVLKFQEEIASGVTPEDETGFGGGRRVCFIGDAAHAMPPNHEQGSNLAFEDVVQLCRNIKDLISNEKEQQHSDGSQSPNFSFLDDEDQTDNFIKAYERRRMHRVRIIHDDQRIKTGSTTFMPWPPAFLKWVYGGI